MGLPPTKDCLLRSSAPLAHCPRGSARPSSWSTSSTCPIETRPRPSACLSERSCRDCTGAGACSPKYFAHPKTRFPSCPKRHDRWLPRPSVPGHVGDSRQMIGASRQHKKQVGQPIQVDDDLPTHGSLCAGGDHRPLRASHDTACDVECGGPGRAPGQYEGSKGRESLLRRIDGPLEFFGGRRVDERDLQLRLIAGGASELGTDREELVLHVG